MKRFDLYGSRASSLDVLRFELESRLGRKFDLHESSYIGGRYIRVSAPPEEIIIQSHDPDDEGYFSEPDFEGWPILVYINGSTRWPELDTLFAGSSSLTLLRSERV